MDRGAGRSRSIKNRQLASTHFLEKLHLFLVAQTFGLHSSLLHVGTESLFLADPRFRPTRRMEASYERKINCLVSEQGTFSGLVFQGVCTNALGYLSIRITHRFQAAKAVRVIRTVLQFYNGTRPNSTHHSTRGRTRKGDNQ